MPKTSRRPDSRDVLGDVTFALQRAYYDLLALLETELEAFGLADDVRPGMGPVLFALFHNDDCIIKELRDRTGLSPSTLSTTLRRTEKAGLVERTVDAEDARAVRIQLTRKGRALRPRLRAFHEHMLECFRGDLSKTELRQLHSLLARVGRKAA